MAVSNSYVSALLQLPSLLLHRAVIADPRFALAQPRQRSGLPFPLDS